jgi:hypothetical protein
VIARIPSDDAGAAGRLSALHRASRAAEGDRRRGVARVRQARRQVLRPGAGGRVPRGLPQWRPYLAPGERGTVLVLAADRKQARVIMRYVRGLLTRVPMLARKVVRETAESFDLDNATTIEVATASYRTTRGHTIVAALLRRAGVLAERGERQSRLRGARRYSPRHGHRARRDAALRQLALRAARCGTRTDGTSAGTAARCSRGRRQRAT